MTDKEEVMKSTRSLAFALTIGLCLMRLTAAEAAPQRLNELCKNVAKQTSSNSASNSALDPVGSLERLNLTDEQKQEIVTILMAYKPQVQSSVTELKTSVGALSKAVHAETFDESAVRKAHQEAAIDSEEFAVLRARIFHDVKGVLTTDQAEKLQSNVEKIRKSAQKFIDTVKKRFNERIKKFSDQ